MHPVAPLHPLLLPSHLAHTNPPHTLTPSPPLQYFSLRRLALMLGIAALLNLARLEGVRRALNRMAGQLNLPLQQQGQQGAAGQVAPGAAAGGAPAAPGPVRAAPQAQQQQQGGEQEAAGAGAAGQDAAAAAPAPGDGGAAAADAAADAAAAPAAGPAPPARPRPGLLREVQALVVGFITSLLPGGRGLYPRVSLQCCCTSMAHASTAACEAGRSFAGLAPTLWIILPTANPWTLLWAALDSPVGPIQPATCLPTCCRLERQPRGCGRVCRSGGDDGAGAGGGGAWRRRALSVHSAAGAGGAFGDGWSKAPP